MSINASTLQVFPVTSEVTPYYIAMQPQTQGLTAAEYVSTTCTFIPQTGVLNATATSARYADLAEIYSADADYEPGTVVVFGGEKEITTTDISHDTAVAGVVSATPAYLMNSEATGIAIALTGRVLCRVKGPVQKGSVLVTSNFPGVAEALQAGMFRPGCILGKSIGFLEHDTIQFIEIAVGRF